MGRRMGAGSGMPDDGSEVVVIERPKLGLGSPGGSVGVKIGPKYQGSGPVGKGAARFGFGAGGCGAWSWGLRMGRCWRCRTRVRSSWWRTR